MKKIMLLFFVFQLINNLCADEYAFYRQMSPEEKVVLMLEEYQDFYESGAGRGGRPRLRQYMLIINENPEGNIPVLIEHIEKLDMKPRREREFRFFGVFYSVMQFFLDDHLKQDDLYRLIAIFEQKIHVYLETYFVIDQHVVTVSFELDVLTGKIEDKRSLRGGRSYADELYERYTILGYQNLRIDYSGLPLDS